MLLFVGRLQPLKAPDVLLRAAARLLERDPSLRDRVLARREARRVRHAPSELELAELDALATRRRLGFAALLVALVALTVARLGPLVVAAAGGRDWWRPFPIR